MAKAAPDHSSIVQPMTVGGAVGAYLFVGPPLGGAIAATALFWDSRKYGFSYEMSGFAGAAFFALFMSYAVGAIPAGLTGTFVALLSPRLRTRTTFLATSTLLGGVISSLMMLAFSLMTAAASAILFLAIIGAIAGLGSGAFALWFWRR